MNYSIRYNIEQGDFSKEELEAEGLGGCDALLLASILREPNGGLNVAWCSVDGQQPAKDKIPDRELFHIIFMLMSKIEDSVELEEWQRSTLQTYCETIKKIMTELRLQT